jgi:hypothetical protein
MKMNRLTRRDFVGGLAAAAAAPLLIPESAEAQGAPPRNLRIVNPTGPNPGAGNVLSKNDFTYLGHYDVQTNGQNSPYGQCLTHRYVGGELRFLVLDHSSSGMWLTEFPLRSGMGSLLTEWTNYWPLFGPGDNHGASFFGLWFDESHDRLWSVDTVDYTVDVRPTQLWTRRLNNDRVGDNASTISNVRGGWGIQGLNSKRVYGGVCALPPWFQSQFGVGPYACGWGGYTSLVNQGGGASMGPTFYAIQDPHSLPNYGTIPTSGYKTGMDCSSGGSATDWYAAGQPTSFDRGVRISPVINYYDSGDPRQNPSTPPSVPPAPGAQWLSPAPDGLGRWTWGDSYYNTGCWIEGPNKRGFVCIASLAAGRAWYQGSTLHCDGRAIEIHVYDPLQIGEALQGRRPVWNVKPAQLWEVNLPGLGSRGTVGNAPPGNAAGATYDARTGLLYIMGYQGGGEYVNRLYVYRVAT